MDAEQQVDVDGFFGDEAAGQSADHPDYLHVFDYVGRRVTRRDLDWDDWQNWQAQLNARLRAAIAFLYGNFVQRRAAGRRRWDRAERIGRASRSSSRCLSTSITRSCEKTRSGSRAICFASTIRRHAEEAAKHTYDPATIGCLLARIRRTKRCSTT